MPTKRTKKSEHILNRYFQAITEAHSQGDAREESFYSCVQWLIDQFGRAKHIPNIHVTVLPKKTEGGNPDFRVWNGNDKIIGYIEAKSPAQQDLGRIEATEQLQRYLSTFPNLILTNLFEFRLYRHGRLAHKVLAARPFVLHQLRTTPPVEKADELFKLLGDFCSFSLPKSTSAQALAVELAKRTRFLRDVVLTELREQQHRQHGPLLGFYEAFHKYLIAGLTVEAFADLYAQTITYGLFAARTRTKRGFNRRVAFDNIPRTIGILRDVFQFVSLGDLPPQLQWIIDDISEVLAVTDAGAILERFYRKGKGSDPIIHFYETFLTEYDPQERQRRGVYYTPEPVVSYITRSLNILLKQKLGARDGLASPGVTLLDPAAGTMTFVARACQEAVREFEKKYGGGGCEEFVRDHILKNYYAFELMMAPYSVGHLKMSFFLEELGHRLSADERFQFYLTNTLEMEELAESSLPGMSSLAHESHLAAEVKKQRPILVILGNPPYSGHSANRGKWIRGLIDEYKKVDGKPLGEKNPKWLQDDYVKFLRFAQWKVDQAGRGIVGMITNHSYLDNPTFRGMRSSLAKTFDEMYFLDLHGNALKRETAPDGSKDENVFDIRQGVAITFLVKHGNAAHKVRHADCWGSRDDKYEWLLKHDVTTTDWKEITPSTPLYLLVPRDERAMDKFQQFIPITAIFPLHSVGIVTSRDGFVFDFDRRALERRIRTFLDSSLPDDFVRESFKLKDNRDWKMAHKRKALQADPDWQHSITPALYRPFDVRWLFYHRDAIDFGRPEVMKHMLHDNLALVTPRRVELAGGWHHALVSNLPVEHVAVSLKTIDYVFPLYRYPDDHGRDLFTLHEAPGTKTPNIDPQLVQALKRAYRKQPTAEQILSYVYAILYAPTYRDKYAEFLKTGFPRIPFTGDFDSFGQLASLGRRLIDLHLLQSKELDPPSVRFEGTGDNRVASTKTKGFNYDPKAKRIHINKTQYFASVTPDLWDYRIGGYQILHKWLKDRRDRSLSLDDIKTYCSIVTAIQRTIDLQQQVHTLYTGVEANVVPLPALID